MESQSGYIYLLSPEDFRFSQLPRLSSKADTRFQSRSQNLSRIGIKTSFTVVIGSALHTPNPNQVGMFYLPISEVELTKLGEHSSLETKAVTVVRSYSLPVASMYHSYCGDGTPILDPNNNVCKSLGLRYLQPLHEWLYNHTVTVAWTAGCVFWTAWRLW